MESWARIWQTQGPSQAVTALVITNLWYFEFVFGLIQILMFEQNFRNHHRNQEATLLFGKPANGKFYKIRKKLRLQQWDSWHLSHVTQLMSTNNVSFGTT